MQKHRPNARSLAEAIADAGALIGDERDGVIRAALSVINNERRNAVYLSPGETRAALGAISQMTDGNARSYDEWKLGVHGSYAEWRALLRAETALKAAVGG